jgi:methanol metabolism-related c-type cytochrome
MNFLYRVSVVALCLSASTSIAQPATAPAAAAPAAAGGGVSWPVFSGYKRYSGNCQVCHGTDGLGGTFAPNLTESLKRLDHDAFLETVVNGKQNAELAMPSFGSDPNVMCYIEDIYTYLKARSDGSVGRGRPDPQPKKPADAAAAETACMGS